MVKLDKNNSDSSISNSTKNKENHRNAKPEELALIEENKRKLNSKQYSNTGFAITDNASVLCQKSYIGSNLEPAELHRRYDRVKAVYTYLNELHEIRPILKYLINANDYKIIFDFSRARSQSVNARKPQKSTKYIYIGAEELLAGDGSDIPLESYGVVIKELSRYVMEQMYGNEGNPFTAKDKERVKKFKEVMRESGKNRWKEPTIDQVFRQAYSHSQEAELLATVPQLLVLHSKKVSELEKLREFFPKLFDFYHNCVIEDIRRELQTTSEDIERFMLESGRYEKRLKSRRCTWCCCCLCGVSLLLVILAAAGAAFVYFKYPELLFGEKEFYYSNCGEVRIKNAVGQPLIADNRSRDAYSGQWPWLAALYLTFSQEHQEIFNIKSNHTFICSATLITQFHLLTAAHCIYEQRSHELFVRLGQFNLSDHFESNFLQLNVSQITHHPHFILNRLRRRSTGDIGVVKMSERVEFTDFIQPACIPRTDVAVSGTEGFVATYGMLENGGFEEGAAKYTKLKAISAGDCEAKSERYIQIVSMKSFCAGGSEATPCIGSSGSGFFTQIGRNQQFMITGVVSQSLTNDSCDPSEYVAVISVVDYIDWIFEIISSCELGDDCVDPCELNPCDKKAACTKNIRNRHSCNSS